MAKSNPLHLTRSPEGIWYYQRWLSKRLRDQYPNVKGILRLSLRTKNKRKAVSRAHIISVKIDKLALEQFDNPDDFARAMKLLYEFAAALRVDPHFEEEAVDFYSELDELDEWLLGKGESFKRRIETQYKDLSHQLEILHGALSHSHPNASDADRELLISQLKESLYPSLPDEENPTLEELLQEWAESKKGTAQEASFNKAYKPAIELFIAFVNDFEGSSIRANRLTGAHIRNYHNFYSKIPKGVSTSKFSIPELVKLQGKPKSATTIRGTFANVGTFLSWIVSKGYPLDGNLQKILVQGSDVRITDKSKKKRKPFTDEDLEKLFMSDEYTSTGAFSTSGMFWGPLIALFTGARMAEIMQLERQDIIKEGSVWCINFDDTNPESVDEYKNLKQTGSNRAVPIHKQLIALGFIQYIETRTNRLFPDEPRNVDRKFDAFSKRQATYRKQKGVGPSNDKELKDFHSFRHTVRTRLSELRTTGRATERFDEGLIDAIVGHESRGRSIGESVYNHSQVIKAKNKALNRLKYDSIDFSQYIEWSKCDFARKEYRRLARQLASKAKASGS